MIYSSYSLKDLSLVYFSILTVLIIFVHCDELRSGCPFANAWSSLSIDGLIGSRQNTNTIDYDAVAADIKSALTSSVDFWPADFGNYGPFMIRLAWHCSGYNILLLLHLTWLI